MPLDLTIFHTASGAFLEGEHRDYTGLPGSSKALFLALILAQKGSTTTGGTCLLLCNTEESADELYHDTVFWADSLGTERPLLIPAPDNPSRFRNLKEFYGSPPACFIASAEAAQSPLWHRGAFPLLTIHQGQTFDRDRMIETFREYGYLETTLVSVRGELSIRGGILDIFPPEEDLPVRIEFFGDEIESLRFFDTDTQRTVREIGEIAIGPAAVPQEGPDLFGILDTNTLFLLNEPDDMHRHHPDIVSLLLDSNTSNLFSLPLQGGGFHFPVRGAGGLGLLQEERKSLNDCITKIRELRKSHFILMVCSSESQAKRLRELCAEEDFAAPIMKNAEAIRSQASPVITNGVLSRGFSYGNSIILTDRDIFGERPGFRAIKKSKVSRLVTSVEDFRDGDFLVHAEHGIGRFLGLRKQKIEDHEGDFIVIEYLGGDRLYVPLERINSIQKYHAPESVRPKMDKLGGKTWQRTQKKVKKKIRDMTEKLLKLYARRTTAPGHSFSEDTELHTEFDGFFLYEETPDQLTAISEIKGDMERSVPMDRLICGDVGYGKTEVAMRACFKAVYDSTQVTMLVPTTILAEQHYETFTSRFSAFPIRVDFLSRFKNRKEQGLTLKALANGDIDIIIGTHRLLAKDIRFHDLGLLIIDEEHKFGVTHKEKIKDLRSSVDTLTLSATPIPRTLHMALSGIRSMSVIETPPEDRLAVRSHVARFHPDIIQTALRKELDRDGQAFFVHNRIHDIYTIAQYLQDLVPEGKIGVAHGQMREKELEQVMRSYLRKQTNILVSTSIIGAGLDIPTANTILINRADKFGLADLYQLRGRVGRSDVRAYAYFLIPGEDTITEQARKKLQAIQELSYLGAGFRLAMRDLEIRGSGNLLGAEQSGHIEAVGFDLYVDMLEQTVAELKGEKVPRKIDPVIDLKITAMIPEHFIEDPDLRLSLYRKIASAQDRKSMKELRGELRDRFGKPPEETQKLLKIMELKVLAKKLAVTNITSRNGTVKILFSKETDVTPQKILSVYETRRQSLRLLPEGGIEMDLRGKPWSTVFRELKTLLNELR
jgi:transcription-repair coupling factor (superfamily II helicase)